MPIEDFETAKAWLEEQPAEARTGFAARCALRALPGIGMSRPATLGLLSLPVLRAILTSGVASVYPTPEVSAAAATAAAIPDHAAATAYDAAAVARSAAVTAATAATRSAATAAYDAASIAHDAAAATAAAIPDHAAATAYDAADRDANRVQETDPQRLFQIALWPNAGVPNFSDALFSRLQAFWNADRKTWGFWARWYAGMLDGKPMDWELQKEIALIPDEVWEAGAKAVARKIDEIEARYLADTIKETITFAPSGRLTLVPQPFQETAHFGQLLDMVRETLDLATANLSNGLSPTCYQAQLIKRALTRYANDPHRIEMTFEQAKRSLIQDMAEEAIPVSPANRDLVQTLGDAAGSLRESDPEIAARRERLNRIRLGQLSHEDAAKVAEIAVTVAEVSEGVLKEDLLEDRFRLPGVKRDENLADPVFPVGGAERNATLEAQAAQLRIYSRLAKIWLFAMENKDTISVAGSIASVIGAVLAIVTMVSASK